MEMAKKASLVKDKTDWDMQEIERLYSQMFINGEGENRGQREIHPQVKSKLHKKILTEIENLRDIQKSLQIESLAYWEIDRKIRSRVLKEIQIIMDAYVVAQRDNRLDEWESMYGDIEHYRREFFYFRMDRDYEHFHKALTDYKFIDE